MNRSGSTPKSRAPRARRTAPPGSRHTRSSSARPVRHDLVASAPRRSGSAGSNSGGRSITMPRATPATVIGSGCSTPARPRSGAVAVDRPAADDHQADVLLRRADTARHGSGCTVAKHAGRRARPRSGDRPVPPTDPRACRPDSRWRARPGRVEGTGEGDPVPPTRDLELAEQVARPRRRPVRPQAQAQAVPARLSTSVVSPYSQMFENGDHTTAPPPFRFQARKSASASAVEWMPTSPSRTQWWCSSSANSSRSTGSTPSAR